MKITVYSLLHLGLAVFVAGPAMADTPFAQHAPLGLRAAVPNTNTVPIYGKFELALDLSANYDNPFDPAQVEVGADFTSPKGRTVHVSGFLDQDFTHKLDKGEHLEAAGQPTWRLRFAPDTPGTWNYRLTARDATGTVSLPLASFQATPSTEEGFVRVSKTNPRMFAFADNRPFVAIGENMCWADGRGTFAFEDWLPQLAQSGGNWIRLWMWLSKCAIEWTPGSQGAGISQGNYHGLGVYSLENAWKLDHILDVAQQNNVYVMVCFGYQGEFETKPGYFAGNDLWKENPYNRANGGPCDTPADFWTNDAARNLYRQRLRYLMARYAWRTTVQGWEFWNEVNAPAPWVGEMARYLKGTGEFTGHPADPYAHLVSTTYGNDAVWKIPEIDFTMTHSYGDSGNLPDQAPVVVNDARKFAVYAKPHLMAEFGIDWRKPDTPYDPDGLGVNFKHGLWTSVASGDAGTAMIWWWDSYIQPKQLYSAFRPVQRFTAGVPWTVGTWKPMGFDTPSMKPDTEAWQDLVLPANAGWGNHDRTEFTVTPHGLSDSAPVTEFLYGPAKRDIRITPTFHVRFDHPGRFVVQISRVSQSGQLQISLDGQVKLGLPFSAAPVTDPAVKPEYEKTELNQEYKIYVATYNRDYGIDVPAGQHDITLENTAGDWIELSTITLTGYRSSRYPAVYVYGQTNGSTAVLWAQNTLYNWKSVLEKKTVPPLHGVTCTAHGLNDGVYAVEWWDTGTGEIIRRDTARSKGDRLELHLPDLATDVAALVAPTIQP